jgi:hypothetical protein
LAAILAIQTAQRRRHQPGDQSFAAKYGARALAKRDIAIVARCQTALTIRLPVGNRHRQHWPAGGQRRLQQGCVKMQQAPAIGRRPFGEDGDMLALCQNFGNLRIDDPRVATAAPAQENRVVFRCQPADHRPVPDLFLRNESCGQHGIDHQDIDPRDVVGHQQDAGRNMGQISFQFYAQRPEQCRRPASAEAPPHGIVQERDEDERKNCPAKQQQGKARNTEEAKKEEGFVQSACPR